MSDRPILDELEARGLIADVTARDDLARLCASEVVRFYIGFDPTSTSLHVGNLVQIATMVRMQRAGHKPYALVGGATGMVGNPSGKSEERNLLDGDTLSANVAAIRQQLSRFLDFGDGPTGAVMVNNHDWFGPIGYLQFLRDVGKHLTINYMMAKDSVRTRLSSDQGISYTEFSYMLLQAYDFVVLARDHGCRLQIGGSDQWGNITAGTELHRKLHTGGSALYGLTTPLLLDAHGQKMGKTAAGTRVWLDAARTSPYAFYQYWLNVEDADVGRLLRIFSWRPLEAIDELLAAHVAAPEKRSGQRALAEDITTFVHGADCTARARAASEVMFGGSLESVRDADLEPLLGDVPSSELDRAELERGVELLELMTRAELAPSKGAARRLVSNGGCYLNNLQVRDPKKIVSVADLGTETMLILRSGKRSYHIMRAR